MQTGEKKGVEKKGSGDGGEGKGKDTGAKGDCIRNSFTLFPEMNWAGPFRAKPILLGDIANEGGTDKTKEDNGGIAESVGIPKVFAFYPLRNQGQFGGFC